MFCIIIIGEMRGVWLAGLSFIHYQERALEEFKQESELMITSDY